MDDFIDPGRGSWEVNQDACGKYKSTCAPNRKEQQEAYPQQADFDQVPTFLAANLMIETLRRA
jgi:hypothetical protein